MQTLTRQLKESNFWEMKKMSHPPCSQDLAANDFLFRDLKNVEKVSET